MSEQDWADKAAIEVFYKVKGTVFMGGLPTYNELPPYVRAEVDAIASLIRSHTAPRELVDSIRHLLFHLEREYTGNGSLPSQQLLIRDMNKVRSALSGQEPKVEDK